MRRPWETGGHRKWLNETLAPLRRYLRSNVGRPWDKIFSEMSRHVRLDSVVQLHVWQHVRWEVCLHGRRAGRDGWLDSRGEPVHQEFVVEARTGLLRENPWRHRWRGRGYVWRPPPSPFEAVIDADERHQYWKISGVWYLVTLAPLPPGVRAGLWDAVHRKYANELSGSEVVRRGGGGGEFYCAAKRQLNTREMRRLTASSSSSAAVGSSS
jgi:hypothetical protein